MISTDKSPIRIGRSPKNEIHLTEPTVSRNHAEIYRDGGKHFLRDLGSMNGTLLNGVKVSLPVKLTPGDTIIIGDSTIIYEPATARLVEDKKALMPSMTMSLSGPQMLDREAPLQMLRTIAKIGQQIVKDLPLETTLNLILEACVNHSRAQRAAILTPGKDTDLVPKAYLSQLPSDEKFAVSTSIVRMAIDRNEAVLIRDVADEDDLKASKSVENLRIRSAICTPLCNGEQTVGVLYVDTTVLGEQFGEMDLLFFATLSGMVAEKIQNAILTDIVKDKQRLDAELAAAKQIQRHFFPSDLPRIQGYDISGFNRPCTEVGGDYFDVFKTPCGTAIVIADVAGKGIGAAILMASFQAVMRLHAQTTPDPSQVLGRLNTDLLELLGEDRFITCVYMLVDSESHTLTYANAGHNPPVLCQEGGEHSLLRCAGIPLGVLPEVVFESQVIEIKRGATLLLYSDGATDCTNPEGDFFGEDRLVQEIKLSCHKGAASIIRELIAALEGFQQDSAFPDDITLVVIKRL